MESAVDYHFQGLIKQVTDEDAQKTQLITTFRGQALEWFMKFYVGQAKRIAEIRTVLIDEFKRPKSEL